MKKPRIYLLVIGCFLASVVVLSSTSAQNAPAVGSSTTVAVCDVVQVFDNYARAKQLGNEFAERGKRLQAEDEQRVKAIENLSNELEGLMAGSREHDQRLNEVRRLTISRKVWMQFQTELAQRDRMRLTKGMYNEIIAMVAKIAKQRGVEIVLYRKNEEQSAENMAQMLQQMELRKVIYASNNVDITDSVLLGLNAAYRAEKK